MYFYPRSPCGERRGTLSDTSDVTAISIHALLAESDAPNNSRIRDTVISIHALLAESDIRVDKVPNQCEIFLSTLSLRRATPYIYILVNTFTFLSTLSLRRATMKYLRFDYLKAFLSTLSLRRATLVCRNNVIWKLYFYPRSPCGERPAITANNIMFRLFLSTLSLRRATTNFSCLPIELSHISIHALLAESDMLGGFWVLSTRIFLSTLSLRRATSE